VPTGTEESQIFVGPSIERLASVASTSGIADYPSRLSTPKDLDGVWENGQEHCHFYTFLRAPPVEGVL
jgi:hypothetical protein